MTKEEMLLIDDAKGRKYTYDDLRDTFLAGGRMNSNHYESWMRAFEEWVIHLELKQYQIHQNDLDLS